MFTRKFYLILGFVLLINGAQAQLLPSTSYVTIVAGEEYKKSKPAQWLWGKNRRTEWATPVQVPLVLLDTLLGGLTPYQQGGSGESISLRLQTETGKKYVLRSINKSRGKTLPGLLKASFFGSLVRDGVSMSHPYAALALPIMLQSANILHTQPRLVYLPQQAALDTFNNVFGNNLYLLEERPEGNWNNTPHLGNFAGYKNTIEIKDSLRNNNQFKADQFAFVKARLFDLFISDVDRHGGNWVWGIADTGVVRYNPVPIDRDQAFFTHNGLLSGLAIAATRRRWLQSFTYQIKNVATLTNVDKSLDEYFTTELSRSQWIQAAQDLRSALTDSVIRLSVAQMPSEIVAVSGEELVKKLTHRRNDLEDYAIRYYNVLTKNVAINGSAGKEYFKVTPSGTKDVTVSIYRISNSGETEKEPYYQRIFNSEETKRLLLYGFDGTDVFDVAPTIRNIKIIIETGINKRQFPDMVKE